MLCLLRQRIEIGIVERLTKLVHQAFQFLITGAIGKGIAQALLAAPAIHGWSSDRLPSSRCSAVSHINSRTSSSDSTSVVEHETAWPLSEGP